MKPIYLLLVGLMVTTHAESDERPRKQDKYRKLIGCYEALLEGAGSTLDFGNNTVIFLKEGPVAVPGKGSNARGLYIVTPNSCYSYPIKADEEVRYAFGGGNRFSYKPVSDPSEVPDYDTLDGPVAEADVWVEQGTLCRPGQAEKLLVQEIIPIVKTMPARHTSEMRLRSADDDPLDDYIARLERCQNAGSSDVAKAAQAVLRTFKVVKKARPAAIREEKPTSGTNVN